jgi:hypothetical protein
VIAVLRRVGRDELHRAALAARSAWEELLEIDKDIDRHEARRQRCLERDDLEEAEGCRLWIEWATGRRHRASETIDYFARRLAELDALDLAWEESGAP